MKKVFLLFFFVLRFVISGSDLDLNLGSERFWFFQRQKWLLNINFLLSANGPLSRQEVDTLKSLTFGMCRLFEKADFRNATPLSSGILSNCYSGFLSNALFARFFFNFLDNSEFLKQILFELDETGACQNPFLNEIIPDEPFFFEVSYPFAYHAFVIEWIKIFEDKFYKPKSLVGMFHFFQTFLFLQVHFLYFRKPFDHLLNVEVMDLFLNIVKDLSAFYIQPFFNSFQGNYAFFQIWDNLEIPYSDFTFPSEGTLVQRIRFLQLLFCLKKNPDLLGSLEDCEELDKRMEMLNPSYSNILRMFPKPLDESSFDAP